MHRRYEIIERVSKLQTVLARRSRQNYTLFGYGGVALPRT